MEHTLTESRSASLREAWRGIQEAKPGIRIREAARDLGTSEGVLLATRVGEKVVRLQGPWTTLMSRLPELGRVMSLTRNDACILEHKGPFQKIETFGEGARAMATVIGPIETRVFFSAWHVAFAVTEEKSDRVLKSIQVFDQQGDAITKIYIQEESNADAYEKIIADFRADDQNPEQATTPAKPDVFSTEVDGAKLIEEWASLKDTHDFFGMLRRHNVHRHHALELADGKFAYQVNPQDAPKYICDQAAATKLPIMIFAGNRGNIQIHQGKVRTIRVLERGHTGPEQWLNILDPDFNMHLRQDLIHTAWVVRKPTEDGIVTSVELFDKDRTLAAQFFGLRKPGIPELERWKQLIEALPAK